MTMDGAKIKGFFGSLFDLSFSEFVTTRIIQFLYILAIIFAVLAALLMVVRGLMSGSVHVAVLNIILAPVSFFISVLMARVWLELIIVVFRIAENTSRLVSLKEQKPQGQ
jgi:glycerol-3-phosphate acyltransferase PlsY